MSKTDRITSTTTGGIEDGGILYSEDQDRPRLTTRGFTGHEHLAESGVIHMNGRAYDPEIGRFMSVDPFVAFPDDGQSFNPYSYVMNNPLKYTDPSGYVAQSSSSTCNDDHCRKIQKEVAKKAKECGEGEKCVVQLKDADGKVVKSYVVDNGAANSAVVSGGVQITASTGSETAASSAATGALGGGNTGIIDGPKWRISSKAVSGSSVGAGIAARIFGAVGLLLPMNQTTHADGTPVGELSPADRNSKKYSSNQIERLRNAHEAGIAFANSQIDTNKGKKTVLIGENQKERVIPAAMKYKAIVIGAPRSMILPQPVKSGSFNELVALTYNVAWVQTFKSAGYTFLDIGIDKQRTSRSPYYAAEKFTLFNYPKVQKINWD